MQEFEKELVDLNYNRYLECLNQRRPFQPVQQDKISLRVMSESPWSQQAVYKLYQKIPLPVGMQKSNHMLQFDFGNSAAAMSAFQILSSEGLQLQLLGTLLQKDLVPPVHQSNQPTLSTVPVPPLPMEAERRVQDLESKFS